MSRILSQLWRSLAPLSPTDDIIVRAVQKLHALTADQLLRLRYSPGSITYVRARLKALTDRRFLVREYLPRRSRAGSIPAVYLLGPAGRAHCRRLGLDCSRRSPAGDHSYLFLDHTLAVNDLLIAAALLERQVSGVRLADLRHERELRREGVTVEVGPGQKTVVVPDAWLDFELLARRRRSSIVVELDRGTMHRRAFRRKVEALLAYINGPYQAAFGTQSVTIALATTAGEQRVREMRTWSEAALREHHRERWGSLFCFAALPAGMLDPVRVFCRPIWDVALATTKVPLLQV